MMAHIYLEGGVSHVAGKFDSASTGSESSNLTQEPFSFFPAQCFNDIWHEKIISHYLRASLVSHIAKDYVNRGVAFPDLIKEGNLGLARALNNFEFEGGSRFSTYAARCIRQNIERAIMARPEIKRSPETPRIPPSQLIAVPRICAKRASKRNLKAHYECARS